MLKEIKIPKKEKLEHDGIKSDNKTVKRFKYGKRIFEIDLLTDQNTYDIFEVTDGEQLFDSGFCSLKNVITFLEGYFYNEEEE